MSSDKDKRITQCRSCGADVVMCVNNNTKRIAPIDAKPDPYGNVTIDLPDEEHMTPEYRVLAGDAREIAGRRGDMLYLNHFSTCPQSKGWRKK